MRRRLVSTAPPSSGVDAAALAPLVDVVTLLLLFLLRAWSTDPPIRPDDPSFSLASSASEAPAPRITPVDVGEDGIWVADVRVTGTRFYAESDELMVREVYEAVQERGTKAVALRLDADVPYKVVRKLLFTLQQAGVKDVSIVAASRAGL